MLRNILSDVTSIDVTPEHAEKIETLLEDALRSADRETYSLDEIGQKEYLSAVITYTDPATGDTRYGIYDADGATRELEDTEDEDEAHARYEELVRARAENLDRDEDGAEIGFDASDVDGVPVKS